MTDPALAHRRGRTPLRRRMGPRDRVQVVVFAYEAGIVHPGTD